MSAGGVFYQTLEMHERKAPFGPGILPFPDGDLVRLTARSRDVLAGEPVAGTVNSQLVMLASRIRAAMPVIGGVLIGVSINENETADESGFKEQSFVSVEILGVGRVPQLVLRLHQKGSQRVRSAPNGWTARTVYLWATI